MSLRGLLKLRAFLQIAKMLQNLANKPSYAKEAYMMSLNPFVDVKKTRMNQFLNSLCEIGDFYDTLEVSQGGSALEAVRVELTIWGHRWISTWHCQRRTSR